MKPISITEDNGIGFPRNPAFLVSILLNLGVTAVNPCTEWFKGEIQFTENVQSDSGSGVARPSSSRRLQGLSSAISFLWELHANAHCFHIGLPAWGFSFLYVPAVASSALIGWLRGRGLSLRQSFWPGGSNSLAAQPGSYHVSP